MEILLDPELQKYIDEKVQSGTHRTPIEVIRDGLRLLKQHDDQQQRDLESLRNAIQIGVRQADAGEASPFNEETLAGIKERGRRRLAPSGGGESA